MSCVPTRLARRAASGDAQGLGEGAEDLLEQNAAHQVGDLFIGDHRAQERHEDGKVSRLLPDEQKAAHDVLAEALAVVD